MDPCVEGRRSDDHLGDWGWADKLIGYYLNPVDAMLVLKAERDV